jgi:hypothetical protein
MDREQAVVALMRLPEPDFNIVASLIQFVTERPFLLPDSSPQSDEEVWWMEVTGDNAMRHRIAAPLWDELALLQSEPSKNARRIASLKKRLRDLGEI